MEVSKLSDLDLNSTYNYLDYLSWKFTERVELIKGKIFKKSPAPNSSHQFLISDLGYELRKFGEKTKFKVAYAPFDVRLSGKKNDKETITVVQPDISVIIDQSKIDEKGCNGAPELVVEILSPGNSKSEMKIKFDLYEEAGVLEYWIIDPEKQTVLQYSLINNKFVNQRPLIADDILESSALKGFKLNLNSIFNN